MTLPPNTKIAVLCGGLGPERAVSMRSGERVHEALLAAGHASTLIDVGPDVSAQLQASPPDCAFVAVHGKGGDDGSIQSVLDLLGIPYTGSRPAACELAFDKLRAKEAFAAADIPTPQWIGLTETALEEFGAAQALDRVHDTIGFPLVVKPARGGSSLGIRLVNSAQDMPRAIMTAMSYDRRIVIEQHIAGREIAVCILDTDKPRALPAVGIRPRHAEWFDYESRYAPGETEFSCPADSLSDEEAAAAERTALAAWAAVGGHGIGRVDMLMDRDGAPQVLEVSMVPGLTDTSLVTLACEAADITLEQLINDLLLDAIRRAG